MTSKVFFLLWTALFVTFLHIHCEDNEAFQVPNCHTITIELSSDTFFIEELLQDQFPQPLLATCITYTADSTIDQEEIAYLVGIKEGCSFGWSELAAACSVFQLKRKFKTVRISWTPCQDGVQLDIALESVWTFGTVSIAGLLLGKDRYKHYYAIESGQPFDIEHHKQLLDCVKESFEQDGYYNGTVAHYLEYDQCTKTVDVVIVLDRQEQFRVNDIEIKLEISPSLDIDNCPEIKRKLHSLVNSHAHYKGYTKPLIDKVGAVMRRYLSKKGFLDAAISLQELIDYEQASIKLLFTIALQECKEIVFFGNHFFSSNELFDLIASFGRSAWLVPQEVLAQEFEAAYRVKGFWHVAIEPVVEQDRLFFLIQEGKRARLKKVRIEGITLDTPEHMGKKWFSRLIKQPYIDHNALQEQISRLLAWYQRQGYWEAHVLRQEFLSAGKPDTYEMVLLIEEGEQRVLQSVVIEKHPELMECGPFTAVAVALPMPLDMALLHEQRAWLLDYFHQQGFLQAHVNPRLTYDGMCVHVVWEIDNISTPATFGKTIIVGKTRTRFEYILRELRYKEGDVWNQPLLEDSLAALRHLNIYESIYVAPVATVEDEQERNILLKLVEYDPFEVRLRVGFQQVSKNLTFRSGSTYKVGGALLWRNPFKAGDYFCFDADVTKYYRNVSLRYYRPWLGDSPYRTQFKLYSNRYMQPVSKGCKESLYEVFQQGFLVGVSRLFSHVDTGGNLGIELMETANLSAEVARAINFTQSLRDRNIPHAFFEGSMLIDFLDDQVNPARGSLTAISCKGMFPWKNNAVAFFKILFEQSCFYDPYDRFILGMKIRFGHIFNGNFSSIMPPERFYLGGEHSIRSYEADFAPPLGSFINDDDKRVFVPQGGKSMVNASFEARFPLYGNLGGVLFQDLGALAQNKLAELKGGKFIAATGFGLRYLTPIGPIRFDIGFKWHRHDSEQARFAWFLTIGESF